MLTPDVWHRYVHMFDELGMAVYETIGSVPVDGAGSDAPVPDNGRTEAILDLRVIGEQLRHITYGMHELMEVHQWEGRQQQQVTQAWMDEVREAVAPLVKSRPEEIIERHRPWEL